MLSGLNEFLNESYSFDSVCLVKEGEMEYTLPSSPSSFKDYELLSIPTTGANFEHAKEVCHSHGYQLPYFDCKEDYIHFAGWTMSQAQSSQRAQVNFPFIARVQRLRILFPPNFFGLTLE